MGFRFILVIAMSFLAQMVSPNLLASPSPCPITKNDCSFYLCQDEWRGCSKDNTNEVKGSYLVDFGHHYCQKFLNIEKGLFSSSGEVWLSGVRQCLMEKMEKLPQNISCQSIKRKSNMHHFNCYYEKGFCDLPFKDKRQLMSLISRELKRLDVMLSGLGLMFACSAPNPPSVATDLTGPF